MACETPSAHRGQFFQLPLAIHMKRAGERAFQYKINNIVAASKCMLRPVPFCDFLHHLQYIFNGQCNPKKRVSRCFRQKTLQYNYTLPTDHDLKSSDAEDEKCCLHAQKLLNAEEHLMSSMPVKQTASQARTTPGGFPRCGIAHGVCNLLQDWLHAP